MRTRTIPLLLASLAILGLGTTAGGDQESDKLQGDWQVSSLIDNGELISDSRVKTHLIKDGRIFIRGAIMTFVNPENNMSQDAAFILTPDVRPRALDMAGRGRTRSKGIYLLDGDSLIVCLAAPEAKNRPDEFASRSGSHNLLISFRRLKVTNVTTVSRTTPIVVERPLTTPPPPPPPPPSPAEVAAKMRKQLIGTWGHQNSDDVVLITFNSDGSFSTTRTAKQGFRKIFRDPVRTSGSWKLEDGVIVVRVTASTDRDLRGQILSYRVRSLSDTQVNLIDSTGRMHVQWKTP